MINNQQVLKKLNIKIKTTETINQIIIRIKIIILNFLIINNR